MGINIHFTYVEYLKYTGNNIIKHQGRLDFVSPRRNLKGNSNEKEKSWIFLQNN
jgi:hypothetical protein